MDCERLQELVKTWYFQVQDEALAPARMVDFMEKHLLSCEVCLTDAAVRREVKRITDIVLPPSKARKKSTSDEEGDEDDGEVVESEEGDEHTEVEEDDAPFDDDPEDIIDDEDD